MPAVIYPDEDDNFSDDYQYLEVPYFEEVYDINDELWFDSDDGIDFLDWDDDSLNDNYF